MKEYITEDLIVDEAKMLIIDSKCPYILVEGDSDKRLYGTLYSKDKVTFRRLFGWENVLKVIECANHRNVKGIAGIIDRDYHELLQDKVLNTPNLYHTDENDLEMMLLCSSAFDKFISLSANTEKVNSADECRNVIIQAAAQLGSLRYISARDEIGLSFHNMDMTKVIDKSTLNVDLINYVNKVCSRSRSQGISISVPTSQLVSKMEEALHHFHPRLLCNGHDSMAVLAVSLQKMYGNYNANEYSEERLFEALSMGYTMSIFSASNLFASLRAQWETDCEET